MKRRLWWLYAFSHGFPVGLGYAGFGYFVAIWLKQAGCSNVVVPLSKVLLLPLLLRTFPLSFCGVKKVTLNQGMALCCFGLCCCFFSNGSPWFLCFGAFVGCFGMSLFEVFYGHKCSKRYLCPALRNKFVGGYYVGYRCSGLFAKGVCVYIASFLGWQIPYLCALVVLACVWIFLKNVSRETFAHLDAFWPTLKGLKKTLSISEIMTLLFCLIPDSFFEALIIPFWMDHGISLTHIAFAKGGCATVGAVCGASFSVWSIRKLGLFRFFYMVVPVNFFFHLLPLGYLYTNSIAWVYITSLFAHVGHSMLTAAYHMYIVGLAKNARQFEVFSSVSYAVTMLSAFSGGLWALLGSSWTLFFCLVASMNVLTWWSLHRVKDW